MLKTTGLERDDECWDVDDAACVYFLIVFCLFLALVCLFFVTCVCLWYTVVMLFVFV